MSNKTAIEWLEYQFLSPATLYGHRLIMDKLKKAKQMEKEQKIKFAQIVLDKAECSHTGMVYLEEDLEDIYNKTYGK